MSKLNPFVIKKSEEKGVLKINPTPIICKTNCSSHGSVTDPSSSKRFDGLQFFPLRIDKSLVTYEDSETGKPRTEELTFVLTVLAEKCRVSDISSGEEIVQLTPGTIVYLQLKRNRNLSGSADNFLQLKRIVEESGMHMTGCIFKISFLPCSGTIQGKPVTYAKCLFNSTTATEDRHIELLQELAQINEDDLHFQTVLPINNEIIEHYDNLMSGQIKVQELPYQEERKQIGGNNW